MQRAGSAVENLSYLSSDLGESLHGGELTLRLHSQPFVDTQFMETGAHKAAPCPQSDLFVVQRLPRHLSPVDWSDQNGRILS